MTITNIPRKSYARKPPAGATLAGLNWQTLSRQEQQAAILLGRSLTGAICLAYRLDPRKTSQIQRGIETAAMAAVCQRSSKPLSDQLKRECWFLSRPSIIAKTQIKLPRLQYRNIVGFRPDGSNIYADKAD